MSESNLRRIAIYPGTFDPPTNGHLSLVERGARLFDELIVAVASNPSKTPFFEVRERVQLMGEVLATLKLDIPIRVVEFDGLLAKLAEDLGATAIIRGLRAISDFEFEFQMALMNRKLAKEVETVFLMPSLSWVYLSSTIVKDVATHGGDVTGLVPEVVKEAIDKRLAMAEDDGS